MNTKLLLTFGTSMSEKISNNFRPSYRYATISIAIVLYFLGFYMVLYLQSNKIDQKIKENINIVVELNDSISTSNQTLVASTLSAFPEVIAESIVFHPKSEAVEVMGDMLFANSVLDRSPFSDMYSFRMQAHKYQNEYIEKISSKLRSLDSVSGVYFESDSDVGIDSLIRKLSYLFLFLSLIFTGLALIIIYNTLSLSLYADRWEIKTMELVGARKAFIRGPYVAQGRIIGQKAFMLAAIGILITIALLMMTNEFILDVIYWPYVLITLIVLLILSTLITMISTFTVVNKFLSQNLKELHQ